MNISEEKRTQICAALAKAQQEQAAGVMDISEVERVYRFFHLRTLRSLARCIWLISYRVYCLPLYSMFRTLRLFSASRVHAGGSPSSGNNAKKVWRQFQPHRPAPQNPDA